MIVFVMLFLDKQVLLRLARLSQGVGSISENGDLSVRVPVTGKDELSDLGMAINVMVETLEKSSGQLKTKNLELDAQNEKLRNEIDERQQAEGALKESEAKFRSLAEQSPNMIFINQNGRVVYANKKFEEVTGYSLEEFYSPTFDFFILIAPEFRDVVAQNYSLYREGKETPPLEHLLVTKDGRRVHCILVTKVVDYGGSPAVLGMVTDLTERKRSEEALRQSEDKYRNLIKDLPVGITITNPQGQLLLVNKAVVEMRGYDSEEELMRVPASERYYDIRDRDHFLSLIEKGPVRDFEVRHKRKDGSILWISSSSIPQTTASGELQYINVQHDITERKRVEESLLESEHQLRAIFEASDNPMLLIDTNCKVVRANSAAEHLYGVGAGSLVQHDCRNLSPGAKCSTDECSLKAVSVTKKSVTQDLTVVKPDGEMVKYLDIVSPVIDENGEVAGIVVVLVDISERKRLEDMLLREKRRAEQYLDAAKVILAVVDSNEIITLINKEACEILGYREEELIGKNWFDTLVPPASREAKRVTFRRIIAGETTIEYRKNYLLTKEGKEILGAFNNTTLYDEYGHAAGRLMLGQIFTESRRMAERLRLTMENFLNFAEEIPLGIMIVNLQVPSSLCQQSAVSPLRL